MEHTRLTGARACRPQSKPDSAAFPNGTNRTHPLDTSPHYLMSIFASTSLWSYHMHRREPTLGSNDMQCPATGIHGSDLLSSRCWNPRSNGDLYTACVFLCTLLKVANELHISAITSSRELGGFAARETVAGLSDHCFGLPNAALRGYRALIRRG